MQRVYAPAPNAQAPNAPVPYAPVPNAPAPNAPAPYQPTGNQPNPQEENNTVSTRLLENLKQLFISLISKTIQQDSPPKFSNFIILLYTFFYKLILLRILIKN